MQFDKTYIAIRQRELVEIIDLSLHVLRDRAGALLVLWLIGCVPWLIFDWLVLLPVSADFYSFDEILLYLYLMVVLVNSQSQLATALITNFLGKSMFAERPTIWETVRSTFSAGWQLVWVHGMLRMSGLVAILCLGFGENMDFVTLTMLVITISFFAFIGLCIRVLRPFSSEILVLEQIPLKNKKDGTTPYSQRSKDLHRAASSEINSRWFTVVVFAVPLVIVIQGLLLTLDNALNLHSDYQYLAPKTYFPITLWALAGLFAIVRFFSYIDIRIRQEGWDVELRIRAEALKLNPERGQA